MNVRSFRCVGADNALSVSFHSFFFGKTSKTGVEVGTLMLNAVGFTYNVKENYFTTRMLIL
jgi:hypothetical protein